MESWLNCGAGFASTSMGVKAGNRRKKSETPLCHGVNHSNKKQKKVDWKQDDFLSSFCLDKKSKVSSPINQEIDWSQSSSDSEGKVKIKIESGNASPHKESCQIKRKIRRPKIKLKEREQILPDTPQARKILFNTNFRHREGCSSDNTECLQHASTELRFLENSEPAQVSMLSSISNDGGHTIQDDFKEKSERNYLKADNKKDESPWNKNSNLWTSPSFGSSMSVSCFRKTRRKKQKCFGEFPPDEISCFEDNKELPQPDIEDCISSSSSIEVESVEELIFDDDDDDDDDNNEKCPHERKFKQADKKIHSSAVCLNKKPNDVLQRKSHGLLNKNTMHIISTEGLKSDLTFEKTSETGDREAQSIEMSESPMSLGSQIQISGTSTSESNKSSQKIGASDWASIFQRHASPPRDNQTAPLTDNSGKKKHKFSSTSLTGQLARLISREKSSVRFWHHSLNAGTVPEKTQKYLIVKINSVSRQWSFFVCMCDVVEGQPTNPSQCKVLLSRKTVAKFNLKPGMKLQIFPPWQQMDDGQSITLLCTNYVQVISDEKFSNADNCDHLSESANPQTSLPLDGSSCLSQEEHWKASTERHLHLTWACPCSLNQGIALISCPASKHNFNPMAQIPYATVLSPQAVTLHSVTSSAPISSCHSGYHRTLLESIEKAHQGRDCLPPFSAFVLRVFHMKNHIGNNNSLSLLLEDTSGTLAVVSFSDEKCDANFENSTFAELMRKERKQCLCHGLSVQARVNKEKDPLLFSVISQCWLQRKQPALSSQESLDQESHILQLKVPSFCYILQSSSDKLPNFELIDENEKPVNIDLSELERVSQDSLSPRFSAVVILFDLKSVPKVLSFINSCLLVCNPYTSSKYTSLHRLTMSDNCVNICRKAKEPMISLCLLRDVSMKDGMVCCDKYSSLIYKSVWTTLGIEEKLDEATIQSTKSYSLRLPPLTENACPGDIISVEGSVSIVDEELSYSWEACVLCGSEITQPSNRQTRIFCASCHQPVEKTVSKMKMTVGLCVEQFTQGVAVRLNLNEDSIQTLLPNEKDEEGYDVDQVLGKKVKASACVVKSYSSKVITLEQLDI